MEWYEWVMMFGGTGLVGLIIADIYLFFKMRGKKAIDKHKEEKELEQRKLIAEVVKEVMAPSCGNLQIIKDELVEVKREIDEIKTEDIKILKAANRDSLRNQLLNHWRQCKQKGYRTTEDIRNFEYMYESYTKLKGNSFILDIAKQFDELDTKID